MALKSMALLSTAQLSWKAHLRAAPLRLTPIGRSYRATHKMPVYALPFPRLLQMSLIFLSRDLRRIHRYFGLRVTKLQWQVKEQRRARELRRYRWHMKWKAFRSSLLSTVQRMYWRIILPVSPRLLQFRMWMNNRLVLSRVKSMFQPSLRKAAQQKFGGSDGLT